MIPDSLSEHCVPPPTCKLTNSVSKTSKTKVVAIFSGMIYYYYYVVVNGRHSNWLVSEQGRSGVPELGGGDPKP